MEKDVLESINKMDCEGNRMLLPREQLTNYAKVKSVLQKAGGRYRKNGFDFEVDAEVIKARLLGGEVVNDKKKFQFFPTPDPLAARLVELAGVQNGHFVLEPSAGRGAIVDHIEKLTDMVELVELDELNVQRLREQGYQVWEGDFLDYKPCVDGFDRIVANPPFNKNQDVKHIRRMYDLLKKGGRLVTLASASWETGSQKVQVSFRDWLTKVGASVTYVPEGEFKEAGTMISTRLIVIDK